MNASRLGKVVVDANVLIHSRAQFPFQKALIPPVVQEEIRSDISRFKMEKLDLDVIKPSESSIEKVKEKSEEINSPTSVQDEEALALAVEKQVTLFTDDKALQNLSLHMNHKYEGFNTEKVTEKRTWSCVCDNCGNEVSSPSCQVCGSSSLSRKRD